MATPVEELSDVELQDAAKKLGDLTGDVQREANKNPGPGWGPVIDRLNDVWRELDAEITRRLQTPAT